MITHSLIDIRMYNPKMHVSINKRTKLLESIFPPEIVNIIFKYVIKIEGFALKHIIYLHALKFKNKRDKEEQSYIEILEQWNAFITINANNRLEAMVREGIDPNNPAYIPIYRQLPMPHSIQPPWWT